MLIKKIIFLVFSSSLLFAQSMDSLYNEFLSIYSYSNIGSQYQREGNENFKCGFGISASVKSRLNEFSLEKQSKIEEILERPDLQKSLISPSGIFKIHYDTTGINTIAYDVHELALAFDSAYTYEIEVLGYPAPPKDGSNGGDNKFDVYVLASAGGYGSTELEDQISTNKYTSYIKIHNSFSGSFYTKGINAARVTAAHEFHHAIQVGNYLYRDSDRFYFELTSTSMEEFVYDDVNDYYYYMKSYFNKPNRRLTRFNTGTNDGYDVAVWNIFLKEKFGSETPNIGDQIIKRSWELMEQKDQRAIIALQNSVSQYGYSFADLFNEFGIWLYFTGYRAKENNYFSEASFYPLVTRTVEMELDPAKMPMMISCEPTSLNYLLIKDFSHGLPDSIFAVFSNSDVNGTLTSGNNINIDFTLATSSFFGSFAVSENYFAKMEGVNNSYIGHSYIINNELASNYIERSVIDFVYPQPFKYDNYESICFPTYADESGNSKLYIFSSDMNLLYSKSLQISVSGKMIVTWNGLDNNNKKLASGVYIYVTEANGKIKKGKFVILN
ncbi:MAG: hypothetical protein HYS24_05495 [Ignavibacteriales bacterium]|nr:hypothetical protein [Ignavibacteriales bacterium]